jgi:hypothetical protein
MKFVKAMLLLFVLPHFVAAQTVDTMAMRAQTRFLASDALQGRGAGTVGERIAAEYIASELTRLGVAPVANGTYFQRVPLKRAVISNATLQFDNKTYGAADFVWNTGGRAAFHNFGGPITYVGMIDSVALRRVSETRARVVVLTGAMGAAALSYVPALLRAGAVGVIIATADTTIFNLYSRSRGEARYFVDAAVDDPVWQADLPVVIAGPVLSRQLVARERFTNIPGEVRVNLEMRVEDVASANVAGIIRGTDPRLRDQVVTYTAHYDHLGISTPNSHGDTIYNGFSDNAAGVAMLLAVADMMQRKRPARSVMFVFFTGEERGLLGSSYYATHPLIPLARVTGVINLDAGAPPAAPVSWRIAGGLDSKLGQLAKTVAIRQKWTADLGGATPNSDYWPFLQHGVQSIFIIPGNQWENVNTEQQAALRARWDRYHRADDEYHPDFPFSGIARYALMAYLVGRAAAE